MRIRVFAQAAKFIALSLLVLVPVEHAYAQAGKVRHWEWVKTESGFVPYDKDGCYQDRAKVAQEGLVEVSVAHCGKPPAAHSAYRFQWAPPPKILYPSQPFDFMLKTTLLENANPGWTLPGKLHIQLAAYLDKPGAGGGQIAIGPSGNPHHAGEVNIWENLKRPRAEQLSAPPEWWATDERFAQQKGQMRINIMASVSTTWWWSYVYRLVEGSSAPPPKTSSFSGTWVGRWENSLKEQGEDTIVLAEDDRGNLHGNWSGNVAVKGRKTSATTAELSGQTTTRSYQIIATIDGNVMTLNYSVKRLNASGGYEGISRLRRQ